MSKVAGSSADEPVKYRFTDEDTDARCLEFFEEENLKKLEDGAWKVRLEGMDSILAKLETQFKTQPETDPELIFRILRRKPIWKDNNVQVISRLFQIFGVANTNAHAVSRGAVAMCVPVLVDKIGDIKLKKLVVDALTGFAVQQSLQFVLSQCMP
jgi:cytoskeleton-associated protein 5